MKNTIVLVLMALALVCGLLFISCKQPISSSSKDSVSMPEPWTDVTNFSQLEGTWRTQSSYNYSMSGMTVTATFTNYQMTFTSSPKTIKVHSGSTMKEVFSGGSIDSQWLTLKGILTTQYSTAPFNTVYTISFNDTEHSYTITGTGTTVSLTDAQAMSQISGVKIYYDWTQLKTASGIIYTKVS